MISFSREPMPHIKESKIVLLVKLPFNKPKND